MSADMFPPPGTMCEDCGCCQADLYAGEGDLRDAICYACDEGIVCAPKKLQTVVASLTPAETEELAAMDSHIAESAVQPEAPASEPKQEKTTMADQVCAGGCGTRLPKTNKSGFAWGHKNGCPVSTPPLHVTGHFGTRG